MSQIRCSPRKKSQCTHKQSAKIPTCERTLKNPLRKLLSSGKTPNTDIKSCTCTSAVSKPPVKPKKTTKSDLTFTKTTKGENTTIYRCEKCGDHNSAQQKKVNTVLKAVNSKCVSNDNNVAKQTKKHHTIRQFFKNDNFNQSAESVCGGNHKQSNLDTIKEVSIQNLTDESLRISSDSDSDLNPEMDIKKIKEFRQKNYFECHSAKSRINTKPSATSLGDHKCVYRFYLNDRLFPVPLNTDYNNKVRCIECHLPMDAANKSTDKINGTIQTKVKFGEGDTQDMVLLLPVSDTLIIEEKRKEVKPDKEIVYFGVIKLNSDGNSMFNNTLPEDSLALKYQKGYREFCNEDSYRYKCIEDTDVIVL